jgi:hypothetical protein
MPELALFVKKVCSASTSMYRYAIPVGRQYKKDCTSLGRYGILSGRNLPLVASRSIDALSLQLILQIGTVAERHSARWLMSSLQHACLLGGKQSASLERQYASQVPILLRQHTAATLTTMAVNKHLAI